MKIKKNLIGVFIVGVLIAFSVNTFAATTKLSQSTVNTDSLKKVESLGLIDKLNNDSDDANKNVTRADFAKMIIIASGLQDTADSLKYQSIFSDVSTKDGVSGYINASINKGFLSGMADRKFHPKDNLTFAQFCTAAIKALGYGDNDVTGIWPNNYIQKAKSLKITDGFSYKNNDSIQRWAIAVMVDRLLNTNVKKTNAQDTDKNLVTAAGTFTDCIVLGTPLTDTELSENQVLTDRGVYNLDDTSAMLTVGNKYRMLINDDSISKVYYSLKAIKNIVVNNIKSTSVTYQDNNKSITMTLPDKVIYYYNGAKQSYDNIKNVIQSETTIVYAYNTDNVGYEYAVIVDPIYSKPVVVDGNNVNNKNVGTIQISDGEKIIKNGGQYIDISSIMPGDIAYEVTDILNASKYIVICDSKLEGKLTNILPTRLYPNTIQIDNKNYDISKDMDTSKLITDNSIFKIGDTVQISLGYDGKVANISKDSVVGSNVDCIILGNSDTDNKLDDNQILTDKGILYLANSSLKFKLGSKYTLYVSNDKILKSSPELNNTKSYVVDNVNDTKIVYTMNKISNAMTLPDKVIYYYQGDKQSYSNLKNIIQSDTTIVFADNSDNIGYEYAVIFDPIYSSPVIASNVKAGDKSIGNISLSDWSPVVKNGEYINPYSIENGDVVYEVSDIARTNKYILVVDGNIQGKLTGIYPSRVLPKTIQIDNKSYDISNDMDVSKLTNKNSIFKIGDTVQITIGYDNKIINLDYPAGQDNADFAFVMNSSITYVDGVPKYSVKLIKSDGTVSDYTTDSTGISYNGSIVTFKVQEDDSVVLTKITNTILPDTVINKEDMKIGDYYATSNIRVFDIVSGYDGLGSTVKVLNWNDLYSGTLQSGKILYMNHVGDFGDVNILLLNDVNDEGCSYGLVKNLTTNSSMVNGKPVLTYNYTFDINGKSYQMSTTNGYNLGIMSIAKLGLLNGQIVACYGGVSSVTESTNIQAIDSNKIKIKDSTYKFRNDIVVYYKDSTGAITTKAVGDIDITKTYTNVAIYLDKPASYGGKIRTIVITQ